jgi:hypothetical protein
VAEANSGKRKPSARIKATPTTVEEYVAGVPEPARGALLQIRAAIQSSISAEAIETISYGIPAFRHTVSSFPALCHEQVRRILFRSLMNVCAP